MKQHNPQHLLNVSFWPQTGRIKQRTHFLGVSRACFGQNRAIFGHFWIVKNQIFKMFRTLRVRVSLYAPKQPSQHGERNLEPQNGHVKTTGPFGGAYIYGVCFRQWRNF